LNKEPRLRFTDEERSDPALEKPIRKAEKAAARADKAQANIPKKKVRQTVIDPDTGKKTSKLTFEDKKKPPSKLSQGVKEAPVHLVAGKLHKEIRETEQDNVGVESAHKSEEAVETGAYLVREGYHSHKLKPYRKAAQAERQLEKANVNVLYQKSLQENPQFASNPLSRWQQKQAIKKQYAAAKHAGQTAGNTAQAASKTGKAARTVKEKAQQAGAFGFTIPAFAQGSEQAPAAPAEDSTNDSNVIVEETEPAPALTPEGNAALVDDFGGNKQLITVTTKAGNYFYILIDRANEDKKTAVHFLNQVDEADLMALMEDENVKEKPAAVCSCTTKCEAGAVNTACPVCATDKSKCTGKAPEPPAETPEPEKEKPAGLNPAAIVLLLALLGGGGVFAYLKLIKNKPKTKGNDSLDDYDYGEEDSEEWETEDEESDEPDADGGSTEEDDEDSVK